MPNSQDPNNKNTMLGWQSGPGQPQYPQPGQPAQPQYQQPAQPQYQQPGQPAQPQYQQPAQPQYQQPAQPQYQQPAQPQYQQEAQPQYQQEAQPQYQQEAQPQYQQPAQPQYPQPGQPAQPQYQQPAQPQYQQQYQDPGQSQQYQQPGQPPAQQAYGQTPQQPQAFGGQMGSTGPGMLGGALGGGFQRQIPTGSGIGAGRLQFIRMVYLHLTGAIFAFAGLSWLLMTNDTVYKTVSVPILKFALGGRWNWLAFMGLFVAAGYLADHFAQKRGSKPMQYLGLGLYVVAEAVIFLPLLFIAELKGAEIMSKGGGDPHFIRDAAYITLGLFAALTASVFITKKDFSFMRSGLMMFGIGSSVLVVIAIVGGFNLGIIFSFAMVILAGGYVLYYTSQILAHYDTESYVAASLALFSAVALMFWYVIRILMKLRE